jgi:hypothetical protein
MAARPTGGRPSSHHFPHMSQEIFLSVCRDLRMGLQRQAGHPIVPVGDPGREVCHHLPYMSLQVKTYKMKSPTGVPSTLKHCWSERPLPEGLFPTSMWQDLGMGSFYSCRRLANQ